MMREGKWVREREEKSQYIGLIVEARSMRKILFFSFFHHTEHAKHHLKIGGPENICERVREWTRRRKKKVFGKWMLLLACPIFIDPNFSRKLFSMHFSRSFVTLCAQMRAIKTHQWIFRPHLMIHKDPDLSYHCFSQNSIHVFSDNLLVANYSLRLLLPSMNPWTWWFRDYFRFPAAFWGRPLA